MCKINHEDTKTRSWLEALRVRTPARILAGRAGVSYRTETLLRLRSDQAAAADAVHRELNGLHDFPEEFVRQYDPFWAETRATSKAEFLMRPDLGRRLSEPSAAALVRAVRRGADFQLILGDGLSPTALVTQSPRLLPLLHQEAAARGWQIGRPVVVRYCRVGLLNDVGDLLNPAVVVLLIGERPGMAAADSLSAYMAYRPRVGDTDAQRNLVSNIHGRGIAPEDAASRILQLAERMRHQEMSGIGLTTGVPSQ